MSGFLTLGDAAQTGGQLAVAAGGTAAAAIAAGTAWVPFVGPIIAGVSLLVGWLTGRNALYHAQESATTNVANQVGDAMKANLAAYENGQIDQATALANFDALWQQLVAGCQRVGGSPGQRCVTDRQEGACTWKNDGKGGPAGSGDVCWNYFVGFRNPLLQPPTNAPASPTAAFGSINPLWLLAGGAALLFAGSNS